MEALQLRVVGGVGGVEAVDVLFEVGPGGGVEQVGAPAGEAVGLGRLARGIDGVGLLRQDVAAAPLDAGDVVDPEALGGFEVADVLRGVRRPGGGGRAALGRVVGIVILHKQLLSEFTCMAKQQILPCNNNPTKALLLPILLRI